MNATPPNDEDSLRQTLREWPADASLPPRFREGVWRRIARAQELAPRSAWTAFARRLEAVVWQPALAVSCAALVLLAGSISGYMHAQAHARNAESAWRASYVQALDPYQAPRE